MGQPVVHLPAHTRGFKTVAIEAHKAKLGVLLPIPVRRQLRQAAPAPLAGTQGLQGGQVIGDIGERAHPSAFLQHPGPHLDIAATGCSSNVHLRHVELIAVGGIFRRHIRPGGMVQKLKLGPEVAALGLQPDNVFHHGLRGEQCLGQVQKLQVALVVNANAPLRIHVADALRHAGQRALQGPCLVGQQCAGARQFTVHRSACQLGAAGDDQLTHRAQKGLQKLDIGC